MSKNKTNELNFNKWWVRLLIGLLMLLLLGGCGNDNDEKVDKEDKVTVTEPKGEESKDTEEDKTKEDEKNEPTISTSVFEYAKKIEVTDALSITDHLNLVVFTDDELAEGLAEQHVLNQTYEFLQQEDIVGAKTVTVGVTVEDARVIQYTVDVAKFTPNDEEPMIDVVLGSSKIEKITLQVKEYAEVFEWKINE